MKKNLKTASKTIGGHGKPLGSVKADAIKNGSQKVSAKKVVPTAPKAMVVNPMLNGIDPIQSGLTIVACQSPAILPFARNVVTLAAKLCSNKLGVPMPDVENVLALYSGPYRAVEQGKSLDAATRVVKNQAKLEFRAIGTIAGFDYCSNEGFATLLPIINKANGWVILEQPITAPATPAFFAGLARIRNAATAKGVWVMMILTCPQPYEQPGLQQCCEELVEVTQCEHEADYQAAFCIDFINLRDLNAIGIGKTMCSVKWTGGSIKHRYEPFISEKLELRVMWLLRKQGKSMEQIAKTLGTNKSKVSRELKKLPQSGFTNMTEAWVGSHLASVTTLLDSSASGDELDDA